MNAIAKWGLALLLLTAGPTLADAGRFTSLPGNPGLHSASAIVLDSGGNIIYGKDVDTVRPVASITKLMTAIVVLDAGLDLDEQITIEEADKDRLRMTGSRLRVGASLTRRELLLLALMSSENRAAAALGRSYPGGTANFVAQMNAKAAALDMRSSHFADPAGLDAANVSTASDLAKMLPFAGIFLLVLPMLWGRVGSDDRTTTTDGIYLFVVWGGLIAAAWLLSRGLRDEQGLKDES